jgi:hypothetical protein
LPIRQRELLLEFRPCLILYDSSSSD